MKPHQKTIIEHHEKRPKKYYGILYIIIGIIIGFGVKAVITYAYNSNDDSNLNIESSLRPINTNKSILTNPIISSDETKNLIFSVLKPFDQKIRDYIRNIYKSDPDCKISLYFRDLNNGTWFSANENEGYNPASLAKVFVVITYYKLAQDNRSILTRRIVNNIDSKKFPGENLSNKHTQTKLILGKPYTIEELLRYMIAESDNTAMTLLTNYLEYNYSGLFIEVICDLGIKYNSSTDSLNPSMDVKTYSRILRSLYNSTYLNEEFSNRVLELLTQTNYTTGFRESLPPNITVAMKYGIKGKEKYQNQVLPPQLHEAGIFYYPGKPYLLCIMTKGKSEEESGKIIEEISRMIYNEVDGQMQKIPLSLRDRDEQQ